MEKLLHTKSILHNHHPSEEVGNTQGIHSNHYKLTRPFRETSEPKP